MNIRYIPTVNNDPDINEGQEPLKGYVRRYTPQTEDGGTSEEVGEDVISFPAIQGFNLEPPVPKVKGPETKIPYLPGKHDDFGKNYEESEVTQKDKYRDYFRKMANRESTMNHRVQRKDTSATGYFQFLPGNIKAFYDGEDFINDPKGQIEAMEKFTDANLKMLSQSDLDKAKAKGYTLSALAAGMHLGGINGVRKVLNETGNPKDANGTSVEKYMKEFNNLFKQGGILKRK